MEARHWSKLFDISRTLDDQHDNNGRRKTARRRDIEAVNQRAGDVYQWPTATTPGSSGERSLRPRELPLTSALKVSTSCFGQRFDSSLLESIIDSEEGKAKAKRKAKGFGKAQKSGLANRQRW